MYLNVDDFSPVQRRVFAVVQSLDSDFILYGLVDVVSYLSYTYIEHCVTPILKNCTKEVVSLSIT